MRDHWESNISYISHSEVQSLIALVTCSALTPSSHHLSWSETCRQSPAESRALLSYLIVYCRLNIVPSRLTELVLPCYLSGSSETIKYIKIVHHDGQSNYLRVTREKRTIYTPSCAVIEWDSGFIAFCTFPVIQIISNENLHSSCKLEFGNGPDDIYDIISHEANKNFIKSVASVWLSWESGVWGMPSGFSISRSRQKFYTSWNFKIWWRGYY